jgi:ABC-type phosphate transport system substrate-binding protein
MAELAGAMVGNYFLLECLGREGMVEKYLARPTTHGGYDVHLRLFRPHFPDPTSFQERFSAEVRKIWRCEHAHIQPLVEFGEGEELLYIATKADDMPTLARLLEQQKTDKLPLPLVAKLITQICDALQYAHDHGIVHGNVQPSSILVDTDGQTRLTDFSLKQAYQAGDPPIAQVGEGNAAYVAPEQVVGMLEPASDIYAVGVLLFQLLSGRLPYEGESAGEIAMLHANEPIPSLRILRPDLSETVELVVRMALAKTPAARFPTPHALAAALMEALAEDRPPVITAKVPRRIPVKARRTELTWSRAFSLLALLLIFVGLGSTFSLVSFSSLSFGPARGLLLPYGNRAGALPISLPPIGWIQQPPSNSEQVPPSQQPTHQPAASPTAGAQQSPIVSFNTPTPTPALTPTPLTCVSGSLKIDGSFYLAPLLQQAGQDYQTLCPNLTLAVGNQGCRTGLQALEQGQIDLAASDLSVQTSQSLSDSPVAALLYAVIVSPDIQLKGLSSKQLQAVYQGQITNWSKVGGPNEAITVLLHPDSDPVKPIFQAFVLNNQPEQVQGTALDPASSPEQIAQQVAQTTGAITYVPFSVTGVANVHVLAINRTQPTLKNLLKGSYAFWSVEHLYALGTASAQAQAYIQFFESAPEKNRLAQAGALPFNQLPSTLVATHLPGPQISI